LIGLTAQQQTELGANAIAIEVLDAVGLTDPMPGDVAVTVLSTEGDGTADQALLDAVEAALDDESVRPLTDRVRVRSAAITNYSIDAELILHPGPDQALVLQAAIDAVTAYAEESTQIGSPPTQAGFYKALKQAGVYDVTLNSPASQLTLTDFASAYCTGVTVIVGGIHNG
jgi:phage-related baseplate assembly protein